MKKKIRWLLICLGLIILVVSGWGGVRPLLQQLSQARGTVHKFGSALARQDYRNAYAMTSSDFKQATTFPDFTAKNEGLLKVYGDLRDVSITDSEIEFNAGGWHGEVDSKLHFARKNVRFTFRLAVEGGTWKILGYSQD